MLWGLRTLRPQIWPDGEIGILATLKMLFPFGSAGSTPAPATNMVLTNAGARISYKTPGYVGRDLPRI